MPEPSRKANATLWSLCDCFLFPTDYVFGLFAAEIDVDAILVELGEEQYDAIAQRLMAEVERILPNMKPPTKTLMALAGLCSCKDQMRELLWTVSGRIAEEYLCRNGMRPPQIGAAPRSHPPLSVTVPHAQSLRLPYLVTAVIESDPSVPPMLRLLAAQFQRTSPPLAGIEPELLRDFLNFMITSHQTDGARPPLPTRAVRKALVRSAKLLDTVVAPNAYRAFVSAEGLTINGALFDYCARHRPGASLLALTARQTDHVPYKLTIHDKASGTCLGEGCVVFDKTPVLDQVVALTLHVRDRESELALLQTAIWQPTAAGHTHEAFCKTVALPAPTPADDAEAAVSLREIATQAQTLFGTNQRYFTRRKRIMDCIERDVTYHLSRRTGIPIETYRFMSDPSPAHIEAMLPELMAAGQAA